MMPSRGLRIARGHVSRLHQSQFRNLSSAARPPLSLPHGLPQPAKSSLRSQVWQKQVSVTIPGAALLRHASTAPAPTPSPTQVSGNPPIPEATPQTDIGSITLDDLDLSAIPDISQIPVKIGYLQEIGLSWWYGPTSMLEWLLEHIHVYTGMPWWGSIATTALLLRLTIFPLFLKSSDSMARSNALVSVTKPITERMQAAQKAGNQQGVMMAWTELANIRKRAGISMTAQFTPMLVQGVIGFCGFKLVRAMAALPVPGFKDGGFLWLSDLTVPDPYGILPLVMGAAIHLMVRMGGESGAGSNASQLPAGMQSFMLYGMPGVIILIMAWQPGALCVWFTVTGGISMLQGLLLQRPAVRRYFGLAPLYKPTKEEGPAKSGAMAVMEAMLPEKRKPDVTSATSKNAGFMRPQYQAPNLHTGGTQRTIDVKGVRQPANNQQEESGGIMGTFNDYRQRFKDQVADRREKSRLEAKKQAADAYEKRAQGRQ